MTNSDLQQRFRALGIEIPSVLLPNPSVNLEKWAVVACDQYTSEPEYWNQVEQIVGKNPSTLRLVFPEIYLEEVNKEQRIAQIDQTMQDYLASKVFEEQSPGFIYVERKTGTKTRKGLVLALDLEKYDYNKGSQALVRATEGTVLARIPPRVQVRQGAPIELPHIMVLIDDPDKQIIEPLSQKASQLKKLYDFKLMMEGGEIKGYKVEDEALMQQILVGLEKLIDPVVFNKKYDLSEQQSVLLFAMGDGNHSLATAKTCWENLKANLGSEEQDTHPARFALVEIVNIHDDGLVFEPIHRVVFGVKPEALLEEILSFFNQNATTAEITLIETAEEPKAVSTSSLQIIPFLSSQKKGTINIKNPLHNLAVGSLQAFLDEYTIKNKIKIDYVHGEKAVQNLSLEPGNMGFFLPALNKEDFFKTVILEGALPRKTFSMGEANEKRYYLEARKIK